MALSKEYAAQLKRDRAEAKTCAVPRLETTKDGSRGGTGEGRSRSPAHGPGMREVRQVAAGMAGVRSSVLLWRIAEDMTQRAAADLVGVTERTWARWEKNGPSPYGALLLKEKGILK